MDIKAIFFDIDGTLKSFYENELRDSTIEMLNRLHDKNIKLYLCSGRSINEMPLLGKKLNDFKWDGIILFNGQYILDENRECIYKLPICKESLHSIIPWMKENATYPCSIFEEGFRYEINFNAQQYEYLKSVGVKDEELPPILDPERSYTHDTYQICPRIPASYDQEWLSHAPGMRSVRWADGFADMIPSQGGKAAGIQVILDRINVTAQQCMAFGDGGNDIEMLKYCGLGVAMGNASDDVKQQCDYVTDTCENDGILKALQHWQILG